MPRILLTTDKIGENIKIKYETDELNALRMMGRRGSVSATLYLRIGLTRGIIREAMTNLTSRRARQVALGGIICATRFKYFERAGLLKTTCGKCGAEDNFQHLLSCADLTFPEPSGDSEPTVAFLVDLAHRACAIHEGIPIPRRPKESEEIELSFTSSAREQGANEEAELSFTASESGGRRRGEDVGRMERPAGDKKCNEPRRHTHLVVRV